MTEIYKYEKLSNLNKLIILSLIFISFYSPNLYSNQSDTIKINELFTKAENISKNNDSISKKQVISIYLNAIKLSDSLNNHIKKAESYSKLGNYYRNKGDYQNALENLFKALKEVNGSEIWLKSAILNNIGVVYRRLDDYNTALEYHLKALKIAENIGDNINIATSWNSIGNINAFLNNHEEALSNFRKALDLEKYSKNMLGEAINYNNIGEVYSLLNNLDSAKYYFEMSLLLNQQMKNNKGIAINYNSLGSIYKTKEKYNQSLEYFSKAIELDRLSADKIYVLRSLNNIGEVQLLLNLPQKAISNFFEALGIALELGSKFEIHRTYKLISDAYRKLGEYNKALDYFDKSKIYGDSVFNEKKANSINHLQILYNVEKKERQIQLLQRENENESNVKIFLLIISIIVLLFAFVFYRRFKIQSLLSKTLKEKNSIIESKNFELLLMNEKIQEQNTKLESLNLSLLEKNNLITKAQENLLLLNNDLKEANNTKDKFFSIISHDLKNPFNYLLATTDLLNKNFKNFNNEQIKSQIDNLHDSARQVYNLLENLLGWAGSQRGTFHNIPTDIDFYEIALNNILLFKSNAAKKSISLKFDVAQNTYIYTDYNLINTVVRNLISNAIKFTNFGGIVELNVKEIDNCLEISVKDNGIGISQDRINKLFKINENISTKGTANENGTGLGLVLVNEFIEKMGGKLNIKSEPNYGTEFTFTVPLSKLQTVPILTDMINIEKFEPEINLQSTQDLILLEKKLFEYLTNDLVEKRNYLIKVRQVGLIRDFANQVIEVGNLNTLEEFSEYGNNLLQCLEVFDFERIEKSLNDFDKLIKLIKLKEN